MDGDAFFVGVEVAKNSRLTGKPVVTGEEKGIVSALSYEAKALGVTRGMPVFELRRRFPQVIILPGDYRAYARYSAKMFDIVRRYADEVEEYSIDECFAELTGLDRTLKMSYAEIALRIQREIMAELGLSVSIGLAPTKSLAKVASKWVKPVGFTEILPEYTGGADFLFTRFLSKIPIGKIWGIGPASARQLNHLGIQTAQDLTKKNIEWIRHHFDRPLEVIWNELRGTLVSRVDPVPKTTYSSIQKTQSFHPATDDRVFLMSQLSRHIENACAKARHFGLAPRRFSIFLKTRGYAGSGYEYVTRSFTLHQPTGAPEIMIEEVRAVLGEMIEEGRLRGERLARYVANMAEKERGRGHRGDTRVLFRTTGVTLHELIPDDVVQDSLFEETAIAGAPTSNPHTRTKKFEIIHKQIDHLERKYGRHVVYLASTHDALRSQEDRPGTDADSAEDADRNLLFL